MAQGKGSGGSGDGSGRGGAGVEQGRGRQGSGGPGRGSIGKCFCPDCDITVPKEPGVPCKTVKCPSCGKPMVRD